MTSIYQLINKLLFVLLIYSTAYSNEVETNFCLEYNHLAAKVKKEFEFLFIPKDVIVINDKENCIEIRTSDHRAKLLEKAFLAKYNLLRPRVSVENAKVGSNCNINYIVSAQREISDEVGVRKIIDSNVSELIIGLYRNTDLMYGENRLWLECSEIKGSTYELTLYLDAKNKDKYHSVFELTPGQSLELGKFVDILNNQLKLGNEELLKDIVENKKYEIRIRSKE